MSAHDQHPGCPHCGENENLVREDVFNSGEYIVICNYCGWSGPEDALANRGEGDDDTAA